MPTLKELIRSIEQGDNLVVTYPHARWLEMPEQEQVYSPEAIEHVSKVLRREYKHERSGRFSPSAMGKCPRRIVLGYAGAPQLPPDLDNQEQMDHGSWTHLKWQAEGITMGWMKAAEVWTYSEDLWTGGSMDGDLEDGSNFELKTAGWNVYSKVVTIDHSPNFEALLQDATYKLLADKDWSSIVYEDRSSGQFHEFRYPRDAKLEKEVIRRIRSYQGYVEQDELPPVLPDCEMRVGTEYRRCPFRKNCLKAKTVSQFEEAR